MWVLTARKPKGRKVVNMTIRELKDRVPYVKGIVKLPSPKGLREADIPIIADTDDSLETCLGEECRAVVYMNGLVLYTRGKYATVFRLHKCRETYGKGSARSFTEVPYQFMLMLEGEHRLEYNSFYCRTVKEVLFTVVVCWCCDYNEISIFVCFFAIKRRKSL